MYIFCRFDEVLAIRWPKMMKFLITGSQKFFANFVIYTKNERKTTYRFIVHTTIIFEYAVNIFLLFTSLYRQKVRDEIERDKRERAAKV